MAFETLAKYLVVGGAFIALTGLLLWAAAKAGIPLGRLPGDMASEGQQGSFYFPIVTCIAVSIALTILINLLIWLFRK